MLVPRRFFAVLCALGLCPVLSHGQEPPKPLNSTAAVRELDRTAAERHLPVEVRGIVTFAYGGPKGGSFVLEQDGTGIYVSIGDVIALKEFVPRESLPRVSVGDEVEVRGVTAGGGYSPCILPREIHVFGKASLPPPYPFALSDVLSGTMESKRVEVRGVVQGAVLRPNVLEWLRLDLATPGHRFVTNLAAPGNWTPEQLIGASVRVHAICHPFFNQRGELLGVRLQVARSEDLVIEKPAPADPFAVPAVELTRLQPFSPAGITQERRRLTGTVTLCRPGEYLYIEDAGRAVRVNTRSTTRFVPGDRVEASGFIDIRENLAELHEAVLRGMGAGPAPAPLAVTRAAVLAGSIHEAPVLERKDYNGKLIMLEGWLERIEPTEGNGRRILFVTDGQVVSATLDGGVGSGALDKLQPGSDVQVTGIAVVQFAGGQIGTQRVVDYPTPTGLSLLLGSPGDIRVVRAASWWTAERLWLLLGGISTVLAAVLAWNWLLRRQVERRSSQLAEEMRARRDAAVEFQGTLRERERLAADLHDTLEQSLIGLSFQLQATEALHTEAPERSARHLGLARQLLTRSRDEVRRSIWNLRSQSLEGRTLPEALRDIAASQAEGRAVRIVVETDGTPRPLPDFVAGNLLLFVQESLTNALKHAAAEEVVVRVRFAADRVSIDVVDDGRGFDAEHPVGPKEGHFGLQGMRERIKRLSGTLHIESAPGRGTRIAAEVPTRAFDNWLAV